MYVEIIGYVASFLIICSLAMTSVVKLRIISLAGSLAYVLYGFLVPAFPVVVANAIIAGLNIYYLIGFARPDRDLGAVEIDNDSPYLADFLDAFGADIAKFHPSLELRPDAHTWLLTREGLPVGVLSGHVEGTDLVLDMDYVIPSYRDLRLGKWVFGPGSKVLRELGVRRVVAADHATPAYESYLKGLGFAPDAGRYARTLG